MTEGSKAMITPEAKARENIDEMLNAAGWVIQDRDELNPKFATYV